MDYRSLNNTVTRETKSLGNAAVYIYFINSNEKILVESDKQFWAASLIKLPILITLFKQYEQKKIKDLNKEILPSKENVVGGSGIIHLLNPKNKYTVEDLAKLMIIVSDSTAANEIIDLVGVEEVNKVIKGIGLKHTVLKHKMMNKAGNGPNMTTAEDMGTLLEFLYEGKIKSAQQILDIMNEAKMRNRILRYIPNNIKTPHKSGSLPEAIHDVGIIFSKNPFIFAFLSDDQVDKRIAAAKCGDLAKLCFDYSQR